MGCLQRDSVLLNFFAERIPPWLRIKTRILDNRFINPYLQTSERIYLICQIQLVLLSHELISHFVRVSVVGLGIRLLVRR